MSAAPPLQALVVGASSGIGREIARELCRRGYETVAIARRLELLETLAAEVREDAGHLQPLACDVADGPAVRALCAELRGRGCDPDLLFLAAGRGAPLGDEHPRVQAHQTTFETNYFGLLRWVEEWFDPARERTFVAISSLMALFAAPDSSAYCASKAALSSAFESLALRHGARGQRFVLVHPGPVATAMLKTRRPLPWTWSARDAGVHIVERVLTGAVQIDFCRPYTWIAKAYRLLPAVARRRLLRRR